MDKEQVSHTTNVSVMADTIAMIVDMQKEVDAQASELLKEKWKAMKLMEQIRPESSEILTARYFEGKTFPEIGQKMFITDGRLRGRKKRPSGNSSVCLIRMIRLKHGEKPEETIYPSGYKTSRDFSY